jgi:hypothetical protein
MTITLELPDDVAGELTSRNGADLQRALLEMVALEGYRSERLTHAGIMRLLGFEHRFQVDAFLKEHQVPTLGSMEELEEDLAALNATRRP